MDLGRTCSDKQLFDSPAVKREPGSGEGLTLEERAEVRDSQTLCLAFKLFEIDFDVGQFIRLVASVPLLLPAQFGENVHKQGVAVGVRGEISAELRLQTLLHPC